MWLKFILNGAGAIIMIKSTGPKFISECMTEAYQNSLMNYRDDSGTAAAVRDYELKLEARLNFKHVIAISSGTAAIHSGLVAIDVGKGSRVAVPASSLCSYDCVAYPSACRYACGDRYRW
jgi:dTDP-4-amino-4,6-dideoxygalactose transaminase